MKNSPSTFSGRNKFLKIFGRKLNDVNKADWVMKKFEKYTYIIKENFKKKIFLKVSDRVDILQM